MFEIFFKKIPHLSFIKNVSFLMGGTLAANILGICFSPVITRIFTPDNFGTFAFFSTIGSIIAIISTLSFDQAIIIEKNDENALAVSGLAMLSSVSISIFLTTLIIIFNVPFSNLFNQPGFHRYVFLLLFFVFVKCGLNILNNLLIRKNEFRSVAIAKVLESLFSGPIKISLGLFIGASVSGLVGGLILGITCALFFIGIETKKAYSFDKIKRLKLNSIIHSAEKYKDFSKYNSWSMLINNISQNMLVLFLSIFYSPAIVGLYALGRRIVSLPLQYIADSFYKVYFHKSSEQIANGENIAKTMKKATLSLAMLSIVPFFILFVFGPSIFSFVFGQEWEISGVYVRFLIPGFFIVFITRPAQVVFTVLRKLKVKMIYTILFSLFRILALISGYFFFKSLYTCFALYSFIVVIFNLWLIYQAYKYALNNLTH